MNMILNDINFLKSIKPPKKTNTYTPISHFEILEKINQYVPNHWKKEGYHIKLTKKGNQLFGTADFKISGYNNLITIGFRNSYDKSISVGVCSGAKVIVCSNLMFTGDIVKIRRHTANILKDIDQIIKNVISHAELSKGNIDAFVSYLEQICIQINHNYS